MLTTRGDISDHDAVAVDSEWGSVDHSLYSSASEDMPEIPSVWSLDLEGLNFERSAAWRWRRRAAMLLTISGIALAAVTFSFGSPINYALTSVNGESTGDDQDLDSATSGNSDALSLLAASNDSLADGERLRLAGIAETTTTTEATTTTVGWTEQVLEPEAEWVDAGNGVVVPDVMLRIRFCESTNNYKAAHVTSSARGAYQFLTMSWDWYGHADRYGVPAANLATPIQQDEAAIITLKKDGTRPWKESFPCWGSDSIPANYATAPPPPTTTTAPQTPEETTPDETTTTSTEETTTEPTQAAASSSSSTTESSTTTTTDTSSTTTSTTESSTSTSG